MKRPIRSLFGKTVVVLLSLAILVLFFHLPPSAAQAETDGPASCSVGIYIVSLHDLDIAAGTFGANFWLWSLCPGNAYQPLDTVEFLNASEVETLLPYVEELDDALYTSYQVRGTFRHDWDVTDYPFDRHRLKILLSEGAVDVSVFVYEADIAASGIKPGITPEGWEITDFRLMEGEDIYLTNFGLPYLPLDEPARYALLDVSVGLERREVTSFVKLVSPVYAAFVLAAIAYLLYFETEGVLINQIGLLAGALFAAVINMQFVGAELGSNTTVTLMDRIHIAVLVYIVIATVTAVYSALSLTHERPVEAVRRLNLRMGAITTLAFIAVNVILVAQALSGG